MTSVFARFFNIRTYSLLLILFCSLALTAGHVGASSKDKTRPARFAPSNVPTCATSTPISVGTPASGTLQAGDCTLPDGAFFDLYTFSGTTGQRVSIGMTSTAFDTYLYLYGADGLLILENDDSGTGSTNSRIPIDDGVFVIPKSGTYSILASSFEVSTGAYNLSLNTDANCTVSPISIGLPATGAIANTDCKVNGGGDIYYTDFHSFSGTTGQKIAVTLSTTTGTFDPYLILRTPSGNNSLEDDDSGGGTTARIPATGFLTLPETGTYILEVSGYAPLETGNYTLLITSGDCTFSFNPTSASVVAGGGTGTVDVTTQSGCNWFTTSSAAWLTVTAGSTGSGSGSISYSVEANTSFPRSATLTVGGQTFTVNQSGLAGTIAGTVRYYGGSQPTVTGVTLTAAGTPQVTATTPSNGTYTLTGLGSGAYTVTPTKTGDVGGIASADAARVAQAVVGLVTLTANQQIAADATGNGTVSSADAARIAQFIVGLNPTGVTGTWKFAPASRTYTSVTSNVTGEDYAAIMVGDVTGNWTQPPAATGDLLISESLLGIENGDVLSRHSQKSIVEVPTTTDSKSADSVEVSIADRRNAAVGELIRVPVRVGELTGRNITSFDMELSFDGSVLKPVAVESAGSLTANFVLTSNANEDGRLKLSAFGVAPIVGEGDLVYVTFQVVGERSAGKIKWESFVFNEGEVPSRTKDGTVRIRRNFKGR